MTKVDFYPTDYLPDCGFTYVIVGARYMNKWVFVRHKRRQGYELPAGHINTGEDPDAAARRELEEETGSLKYTIQCISVYTVAEATNLKAGKLYYAKIEEMGRKKDDEEIDEVVPLSSLPSELGFHHVQTLLFNHLERYHDIQEGGNRQQ